MFTHLLFNVAKILLEQISRFDGSPADWLITLGPMLHGFGYSKSKWKNVSNSKANIYGL
jgi:hypothetical protein